MLKKFSRYFEFVVELSTMKMWLKSVVLEEQSLQIFYLMKSKFKILLKFLLYIRPYFFLIKT